jgi:hypothetical protein
MYYQLSRLNGEGDFVACPVRFCTKSVADIKKRNAHNRQTTGNNGQHQQYQQRLFHREPANRVWIPGIQPSGCLNEL